jgi:membrane protein DedA with SNARE-associated domain
MHPLLAQGSTDLATSGLPEQFHTLGELPEFLQVAVLVLGTYILEDVTSISAGVLLGHGVISWWVAFVGIVVGIITGDLLLYGIGYFVGRPALKLPILRSLVTPDALERWRTWFRRRGHWAVFVTRFIPGTRLPGYLSAGILHVDFWRFTAAVVLSVLLQSSLVLLLSAWLGEVMFEQWAMFESGIASFVLIVLVLVLLVRLATILATKNQRQLHFWHLARWHSFEFWPPWFFYPPVIFYCLYLGFRKGGFLTVTAANPGIETGGLVGERKSEILDRYTGKSDLVAQYLLVDACDEAADKRLAHIQKELDSRALEYPLIAKPDRGQRGSGVQLVKSDEELLEYLSRMVGVDFLIQEYAAGPCEWGVFYIRHPEEEHGRIFSITNKEAPVMIGDGEHTFLQLLLRDQRARYIAKTYAKRHQALLESVPEKGEEIKLVEAGNHCQGTIFKNGEEYISPKLLEVIENLALGFPDLYFTRFDIRFESPEALLRGEFKVVEANGVGAEATHIWDERASLRSAYGTLFKQWWWAYEIGAWNRKNGHPMTSTLDVNSSNRG